MVCVYCFGCGRGQALAQAIKEAKEQHPDMSVTRVVVHKETELAEDDDWWTGKHMATISRATSSALDDHLFLLRPNSFTFIIIRVCFSFAFYSSSLALCLRLFSFFLIWWIKRAACQRFLISKTSRVSLSQCFTGVRFIQIERDMKTCIFREQRCVCLSVTLFARMRSGSLSADSLVSVWCVSAFTLRWHVKSSRETSENMLVLYEDSSGIIILHWAG